MHPRRNGWREWLFGASPKKQHSRRTVRLELCSLEDRTVMSANFTNAANVLTHSFEYVEKVVEATYQRYLGREADDEGAAYWTGWLGWPTSVAFDPAAAHGTDRGMIATIASTPEFRDVHGGTVTGAVAGLYTTFLGRQPDADGLKYWVAGVEGGSLTLKDVALGFQNSDEGLTLYVTGLYVGLLGRAPHGDESVYWKATVANGASNADLVAGFVGSNEYSQRKGVDVAALLVGAYQDILGRSPDGTGFMGLGQGLGVEFATAVAQGGGAIEFIKNHYVDAIGAASPSSLYLASTIDSSFFDKLVPSDIYDDLANQQISSRFQPDGTLIRTYTPSGGGDPFRLSIPPTSAVYQPVADYTPNFRPTGNQTGGQTNQNVKLSQAYGTSNVSKNDAAAKVTYRGNVSFTFDIVPNPNYNHEKTQTVTLSTNDFTITLVHTEHKTYIVQGGTGHFVQQPTGFTLGGEKLDLGGTYDYTVGRGTVSNEVQDLTTGGLNFGIVHRTKSYTFNLIKGAFLKNEVFSGFTYPDYQDGPVGYKIAPIAGSSTYGLVALTRVH